MRISKRVFTMTLCVGVFSLTAWAVVSARSREKDKSASVTPALLMVSRVRPTTLSNQRPPMGDVQYREFLETQAALIRSDEVIRRAMRSPKFPSRNLSLAQLRGNLKVEVIPNTELIRLLFGSNDAQLSVQVTNAVLDVYMESVVLRMRLDEFDRLGKLRQLMTNSPSQFKTEQETMPGLGLIAGVSEVHANDVVIKALEQSYFDHSKAIDQLRVRKAALAHRARTDESTKELESVDHEIADRQALLRETEKAIRKAEADPPLDGLLHREQVKASVEIAREVFAETRRLEIELQAPERIRVVSRAELE